MNSKVDIWFTPSLALEHETEVPRIDPLHVGRTGICPVMNVDGDWAEGSRLLLRQETIPLKAVLAK